jgi:preprotein translocase subunit SecD
MSKEEHQAMEENQPKEYNDLEDSALKLGLDLQGGMHLVLELEKDQVDMEEKDVKDAIDRTLEIIRNRVDQFGVAEPLIQGRPRCRQTC